MTKASLTPEETKIRAVARQYRRRGYTALVPRGPIELPQGLEGYVPDLIATNGRETVLVEVKQSDAVRKANELTLVADRVARLPGWRFELIAIAPEPAGRLATREQLATLADKVDRALAAGLSDMALDYAAHAAGLLITEAGRLEGLKVDHMATRDVARELVVRGVLPKPLFESFDLAWRRRGELMHLDPTELAPSSEEVRQVMRLIENLRAELDAESAAA
ncbi:hypothetical protein GCM10011390_28780 [Aureimonas endophytica]|uniref:REase AHJR-like domain-containing protein n=1 Tax=Aureimonas endophytica TaxID=2027858 RepID=A0A916ZPN1_9HYPH|nr:hypothetical protein [Aureimonas endophytica]GGE07984.1 hypothetical protein GCM10011390_28780 [Aureimonas endophytica]